MRRNQEWSFITEISSSFIKPVLSLKISHLWMFWFSFYCCDKRHVDHGWGGKSYLTLQPLVKGHEGTSRRGLKMSWREGREECCWLACPSDSRLASFLTPPRPTCPGAGTAHSTLGNCPHRLVYRLIWWRHFLKLTFPNALNLCQADKNLSSTTVLNCRQYKKPWAWPINVLCTVFTIEQNQYSDNRSFEFIFAYLKLALKLVSDDGVVDGGSACTAQWTSAIGASKVSNFDSSRSLIHLKSGFS